MKQHKPKTSATTTVTVPGLFAFGAGATAVSTAAFGQIRFDEVVPLDGGGYSAVSADMDNDGDPDVVYISGGGIRIDFNSGDGTIGDHHAIPIEFSGRQVSAGDLDGDRDIDLAWQEYLPDRTYLIHAWFNSGDGRSGDMSTTPINSASSLPMFIRDMDGDGLRDIIVPATGQTLSILFNRGDHTFEYRDVYTHDEFRVYAQGLVPGDFDGDGDIDIAQMYHYLEYYGYETKFTELVYLVNDGHGGMSMRHSVELEWINDNPFCGPMTCGDMDGDGDLDLVLTAHEARDEHEPIEVMVASNIDGERFEAVSDNQLGENDSEAVVVTDIDLDGRLDIAVIADKIRGVYVLQNMGEFTFRGMSPFYTGLDNSSSLLTPDMTGDGRHDLVVGGSGGLLLLTNRTPLVGPRYNHSPLVRGQDATFVVDGAQPGEEVRFLYSTEGVGNSLGYSVLGGLTIDLLEHFSQFGVVHANADGRAVLRRTIPASAPLGPIATQAVIHRGAGGVDSVKTPFRSAVITD